jgi:dephospho-CoA kinase
MHRIGLTGGIGSGKSTVAAAWQALGATVIDADAVSRALTAAGGAAIEPLRHRFGATIIDATGALDRQRMRTLAFDDPTNRQALEAILHPLIGAEVARQAAAAPTERPIVHDVPLLVESRHWRTRLDRVLVVDCSEATQIERVMRRSGWTREAVERVIAQQAPRARRRAAADALIHNEGIEAAVLTDEVRALWHLWCA